MPATKTNTQVRNGVTMTAGAANQTSTPLDLTASYDVVANIKLTNGATGPTVAGQVQIQCSEDNSKYYDYGGPLVGLVSNSGVGSWTLELPRAVQWVQFVSGSNTGQNVTLDIDVSRITAQ